MNKILTVSQVNNFVKCVFDDELLLQNITVEGEIYECKFSGGNTYITLKEGDCVLLCVKFGAKLDFIVGDSLHVTGSMRFYPRGGRTSFVITYAVSVGKGAILVKFNELKDKLNREGVFNNTKKLPRFIKKIALVTSADGAVIHDFLEVLSRNGCGYINIDVYGIKVQGADAEADIVKAISMTNRRVCDVVVVARGGGSVQDLACFNTEAVAREVHLCDYPVISAIGHEVDYTLCDFASTHRAGTPSIAAELIVRNNEAFISNFFENIYKLKTGAENLLNGIKDKAESLSVGLMLKCERNASAIKNKLVALIGKQYSNLNYAINKAETSVIKNIKTEYSEINAKLTVNENELKFSSMMLDRSSPLKILADGYAKVLKDEKEINCADDIIVGDKIRIIMSGGSIGATVTFKEKNNGS